MIIKISPKEIPFGLNSDKLCCLPYHNHPRGCPNYGKKKGCPPNVSPLDKILDFDKEIYLVCTNFEIGKHAEKMKRAHPEWNERQIYCCLYWQPTARKLHYEEIEQYKKEKGIDMVLTSPEAMGINVTALMKKVGVSLEWPPRNVTRLVSIVGFKK